ncbi:MAG: hypothetical protein CFE26_17170 [Verrucomicrobiales bacterium VVV1]|nr:MAG: hypothetical protein CFE26_17170 [Verrucomicrobiales bacterium VVV1]
MKSLLLLQLTGLLGLLTPNASAQSYTNFIRQVQGDTGVQWDATVAYQGTQASQLEVPLAGSRFELWTLLSTPLTSYLLDTKLVGAYVPSATVAIRTEDPYALVPRTRADRPFYVDVTTSGLLSGASFPAASKSVTLFRHVQSYGAGGTGVGIDRTQATLLTQASIVTNGSQTLSYQVNSIPGSDRTAVRGEERFSVFSLADTVSNVPASQLASQYVQIWPLARGSIDGITGNQKIRFAPPALTVTVNDLYPNSRVYVQIYKGASQLGMSGTIIPGSAIIVNDSVPQDRVILLKDYGSIFTEDGQWTMELVTSTPFGIDRLSFVSFTVDRTIRVNGMINTQN